MLANASSITFGTAVSNGSSLTVQISGFDDAGHSIHATFSPTDISLVPNCSCSSGEFIQASEAGNMMGLATVSGLPYSPGSPPFGYNEGGSILITGFLPTIAPPYVAGLPTLISFPISYNIDVFFYTWSGNQATTLFELRGAGSGTAYASLTIQDTGSKSYSGQYFQYSISNSVPEPSTVVPEPSTVVMIFSGLMVVALRSIRKRHRRAW